MEFHGQFHQRPRTKVGIEGSAIAGREDEYDDGLPEKPTSDKVNTDGKIGSLIEHHEEKQQEFE